jgi:hypothetical protein
MSGLEVAGVVLGALPLVISALEHYVAGVNTAKRFWRYKSELRSLILQIETERGIFLNTLEQLLEGVVRIENMDEFLSDPGGGPWRDPSVEFKLRERLRGVYKVYLDNVNGMAQSMGKIMAKLALDAEGKVRWSVRSLLGVQLMPPQPQFADPNLFKQEYKRLKFSLSRSEYTEQLNELKNCNKALGRLTTQSRDLERSRLGAKGRTCPNFNALQSYARALFSTLRSGLTCNCEDHAVKLRLESRDRNAQNEDELLESTQSRVIFMQSSSTSASDIAWKETKIQWIAEKPQSVPVPLPRTGTSKTMRAARQVRFDQPQAPANINGRTVTCTAPRTMLATTSTTLQIQNLCQTMAKFHQSQADDCAGYLVDNLQRKYGIYPCRLPVCPDNQTKWSAYTLRQVITQQAGFGRPLTQRDTYKVAVELALSVLQFYQTPWLSDNWSGSDVYFVHRTGTPLASVYHHPFVYRKLSHAADPGIVSQSPARRVIRNETLFTLGILLIELLYRKPMQELQEPQDRDCEGTPGVIWCTAERLIENEEIADRGGEPYADAVRRCIRCDFNSRNTSLCDQNFQRAVYDGVVAPLEATLQHFNGEI